MSEQKSINESAQIFEQYRKDENVDKLLESLTGLGEEEQRQAGESLEALKRPVKEMMNDQSNQLPNRLHELKEMVSQLEPDYLRDGQLKKWFNRVLGRSPIEQYARSIRQLNPKWSKLLTDCLAEKISSRRTTSCCSN